jgi:hypothetical protein
MIPQLRSNSKQVFGAIAMETAEMRCRILTAGVWVYAPDIEIPQD